MPEDKRLIREQQFSGTVIKIGSGAENDVIIPDSALPASLCVLMRQDGGMVLSAFSPGMERNGKKISSRNQRIATGDTLMVRGDTYEYTLLFRVEEQVSVLVWQQGVQPERAKLTKPRGFSNILLSVFLVLLGLWMAWMCSCPILNEFSADGRENTVFYEGESLRLSWDVSPFAWTVTLDDGKNTRGVGRQGSVLVTPEESVVYTLTATNPFRQLFGKADRREVRAAVLPRRSDVISLTADPDTVMEGESVTLRWNTDENAKQAVLIAGDGKNTLTADELQSSREEFVGADRLITLDTGSGFRSLFIPALPLPETEIEFSLWVRPDSSALPMADYLAYLSEQGEPLPQGNGQMTTSLKWTDVSQGAYALSRESRSEGSAREETVTVTTLTGARSRPQETLISAENDGFEVELCRLVRDEKAYGKYRAQCHYPGYALGRGEQVLLRWNVPNVSTVSIPVLSNDPLPAQGSGFVFVERSQNVGLSFMRGGKAQAYALPVNVSDETRSESPLAKGTSCSFGKSSETLSAPGDVTLHWLGGGVGTRVQILSDSQAEKEKDQLIERLRRDAEARGEGFTEPMNLAVSGGILADWLQESGFMKVRVSKNTTFMLRVYDSYGTVPVCEDTMEVRVSESDKRSLKIAVTRIADTADVPRKDFALGSVIRVTAPLSAWEPSLPPGGSVTITDGLSSCTANYPADTCELRLLTPGQRTLTALYSGDTHYRKVSATATVRVIDPIPTETIISSVTETGGGLDGEIRLNFDDGRAKQYGVSPTGTLTLISDKGSCEIRLPSGAINCSGSAAVSSDGHTMTVTGLPLNTVNLIAAYSGDGVFLPSASDVWGGGKRAITAQIVTPKAGAYFDASGKNSVRYPENPLSHSDPYTYCAFGSADCVTLSNTALVTISLNGETLPDGTKITVRDGPADNYANTCTITLPALSCTLRFTETGARTITASVEETDETEAAEASLSFVNVLDFTGVNQIISAVSIRGLTPAGPYGKGDVIHVSADVFEQGDNSRHPSGGRVTVFDSDYSASCSFDYSSGGDNGCDYTVGDNNPIYLYAFYAGSDTWRPGKSGRTSVPLASGRMADAPKVFADLTEPMPTVDPTLLLPLVTAEVLSESSELIAGKAYPFVLTVDGPMDEKSVISIEADPLFSTEYVHNSSSCAPWIGDKLWIIQGEQLITEDKQSKFRCELIFRGEGVFAGPRMRVKILPALLSDGTYAAPTYGDEVQTIAFGDYTLTRLSRSHQITLSDERGNLLCSDTVPCQNLNAADRYRLTYQMPAPWDTVGVTGDGSVVMDWPAELAERLSASLEDGDCMTDDKGQSRLEVVNGTASCWFRFGGSSRGLFPLTIRGEQDFYSLPDLRLELPNDIPPLEVTLIPSLTLRMTEQSEEREQIVNGQVETLYRAPAEFDIARYTLRICAESGAPLMADGDGGMNIRWPVAELLENLGALPDCMRPLGDGRYALGTLRLLDGKLASECSFVIPPTVTLGSSISAELDHRAYTGTTAVTIPSQAFREEVLHLTVTSTERLFPAVPASLVFGFENLSDYQRALLGVTDAEIILRWSGGNGGCTGPLAFDSDGQASCPLLYETQSPPSSVTYEVDISSPLLRVDNPTGTVLLPEVRAPGGKLDFALLKDGVPLSAGEAFTASIPYTLRVEFIPETDTDDFSQTPVTLIWDAIPTVDGKMTLSLEPREGKWIAEYEFRFEQGGIALSTSLSEAKVQVDLPGWNIPYGTERRLRLPGTVEKHPLFLEITDVLPAPVGETAQWSVRASVPAETLDWDALQVSADGVPVLCALRNGEWFHCSAPLMNESTEIRVEYLGDSVYEAASANPYRIITEKHLLTLVPQPLFGLNEGDLISIEQAGEDGFGYGTIQTGGIRFDAVLAKGEYIQGSFVPKSYPVVFEWNAPYTPNLTDFSLEIDVHFGTESATQTLVFAPVDMDSQTVHFLLDFGDADLRSVVSIEDIRCVYGGDARMAPCSRTYSADRVSYSLKTATLFDALMTYPAPEQVVFEYLPTGGAYSLYCSQMGEPLSCVSETGAERGDCWGGFAVSRENPLIWTNGWLNPRCYLVAFRENGLWLAVP